MLSLEESLKHYTVQQLRKEIANYNKSVKIPKYVKLEKDELIKLILMHKSKFMHLVLEKAPEKKEVKKKEPTKKEVMKKEEEVKKKEEEGRIVQKVIMSKKIEPLPEPKKEEEKKVEPVKEETLEDKFKNYALKIKNINNEIEKNTDKYSPMIFKRMDEVIEERQKSGEKLNQGKVNRIRDSLIKKEFVEYTNKKEELYKVGEKIKEEVQNIINNMKDRTKAKELINIFQKNAK